MFLFDVHALSFPYSPPIPDEHNQCLSRDMLFRFAIPVVPSTFVDVGTVKIEVGQPVMQFSMQVNQLKATLMNNNNSNPNKHEEQNIKGVSDGRLLKPEQI